MEYDHYSKQCPSHPIPPIHREDVEDLISKVLIIAFIILHCFVTPLHFSVGKFIFHQVERRVEVAQEKAKKEEEERRIERERLEAEQRASRSAYLLISRHTVQTMAFTNVFWAWSH